MEWVNFRQLYIALKLTLGLLNVEVSFRRPAPLLSRANALSDQVKCLMNVQL